MHCAKRFDALLVQVDDRLQGKFAVLHSATHTQNAKVQIANSARIALSSVVPNMSFPPVWCGGAEAPLVMR